MILIRKILIMMISTLFQKISPYNEYKKIELNKVKNKLLAITGDVIGFHSELRENMKKNN